MSEPAAQSYEPNSSITGERNVKALTTLSRTGCQAVEWEFDLDRMEGEWRPCGLPPFATVYAGEYDETTDTDMQPVLCWRHLLMLGDTGSDLVVRVFVAAHV